MQRHPDPDRAEPFLESCRKAGLRITPQRRSVYTHLLRSKTHPTADEIFRSIRDEHPNISYDTVNRALLKFAEIGLADIVQTKGGARRFDPVMDGHHHFQCVDCGIIVDFSDKAYEKLGVPENIRKRFTVYAKRVVLSGLCPECRSSTGRTEKSRQFNQT